MADVFDHMRAVADDAQREEQQLNFQERIVKQLLRNANVPIQVGALKAEARQKYGTDWLDFQWFREEFPRFPVRLMAQKLKYRDQPLLSDLYGKGRFKQLAWWKEFENQAALFNVNLVHDRAALLFNLPHAKDAFLMVLHNQPVQSHDAERRDADPWPRTIFPIGKSGIVAVLESFESFLQTVGTEWNDS